MRACEECGAEFGPKRSRHRFCSRRCSKAWFNRIHNGRRSDRRRAARAAKRCLVCGKRLGLEAKPVGFRTGGVTQFYCDKGCREWARALRRKEQVMAATRERISAV